MTKLRPAVVCLILGVTAWSDAYSAWDNVPPLDKPVVLFEGTQEIDYPGSWNGAVTMPVFSDDQVPVLAFRARLHTPGEGGCNWLLQVLVNNSLVTDTPFRQRLLNKPFAFDPPGTQYHFEWFHNGRWMMIFAPTFETNWGGSGHDTEFLIDLSGLVRSGEKVTVAFVNAAGFDIAGAIGVKRAPIVVERPTLGLLPRAQVEELRQKVTAAGPVRTVTVQPDLPPDAKPGPRAYEIVWSGRPAPASQVNFDDLRGWRLRVYGDAEVSLSASVDQLLWRPRVAKFTYAGGKRSTYAEISPPEPITIPGEFDAVNLWLYGALKRQIDTPLRIAALLEDAEGHDVVIDLGPVTSTYWGLQHGILQRLPAASPKFPMKFKALVVGDCKVEGERRLYLDCTLFYRQNRRPARQYQRPVPTLFPTSGDGILPTPPTGVRITVRKTAGGAQFVSEASDGRLVFSVDPARGVLAGVSARWGDGPRFQPFRGGDILIDVGGGVGNPPAEATLVSAAVRGDRFEARWRAGSGPQSWSATYSCRGRTLIIDVKAPAGVATGLRGGRLGGLPSPKAIAVPYLYINGPVFTGYGAGVFVSILADWYHSDFSHVTPGAGKPDDDSVELLSATSYKPLTNGRRNALRDRLLVTVSPRFEDVLPNPPNPPSPNRERLAPYMFFMASSLCPNLYRTWKRYGIDFVIANDFASLFVDSYAEGFAMRWRPHPDIGLDAAKQYVKSIKELGYIFGAYADFTDYFPLNEFWDESKVCLTSDGDFLDAWYGNFATKPTAMPELMRAVGAKCRQLYQPGCVYLDVHSNLGPSARDFEAEAAGAGIARTTVLGNGDAMVLAREFYGSTISEGYHRWLYAGLTDMDYATLPSPSGKAADAPLLVDFDLLKIHPREHGTMMGYGPRVFLSDAETEELYSDPGRGLGPAAFYRYLAASLAYGHMLLLGYGYVPPLARIIQYYALMQAPQREYLPDQVAEIAYHDGSRFLSTSEALASDGYRKGRVRVRYSRGLVVQVNYNPSENWEVEWEGRRFVLPPYGWLIAKPSELIAYSALVNGSRLDYVSCADYIYLNSGQARVREGCLEVSGAVWLKREGPGWRLIPCGNLGSWRSVHSPGKPRQYRDYELAGVPADRGCQLIILDTEALIGRSAKDVTVGGRDYGGRVVPCQTRALEDGRLQIVPQEEVVDYLIK
ncbi:MAG: hypothetical protein H5T86_03715 [Armatimonadetes bacterium]|nr:hypothetical protein [Armatimonadota bacterium]